MLKLIYHTAVFGPIDLEYDVPVISVGRSEDNDLVLRHPSILPHHCLLVFRGEKVLCLPPRRPLPAVTEVRHLTGPELGLADPLQLGELQFSLAHSGRTVALPDHNQGSLTATPVGAVADQQRYYCPFCRVFVPDAGVKRVGLVGHAKRDLCAKCSRPLAAGPEPPNAAPDPKRRLLPSGLSRVLGSVQTRLGRKGS